MTVANTPKFTDAVVTKMVNEYTAEPTAETVKALAEALNFSVASVRAKLVNLGVYVAKAGKAAEKRETKAEVLTDVAKMLGLEANALESLDKGSVEAIKALRAAVRELRETADMA